MKFTLRQNRFVRVKGQEDAVYVTADPDHPVVIDLPDDTITRRLDDKGNTVWVDRGLVPVTEEPPAPVEAPKPAHAALPPRDEAPRAADLGKQRRAP
jgi:hypothetical protein